MWIMAIHRLRLRFDFDVAGLQGISGSLTFLTSVIVVRMINHDRCGRRRVLCAKHVANRQSSTVDGIVHSDCYVERTCPFRFFVLSWRLEAGCSCRNGREIEPRGISFA